MIRDLNSPNPEPAPDSHSVPQAATLKARVQWGPIIRAVWVCTVILWPILRWLIALDCVIQFLKTMYHWNTPGSHATLVFILHFFALSALTYFVSAYLPKGF